MSLIKNVTTNWSNPVVLAADEIWQARWGSVFLTTTANPDPNDGFALEQGQGVMISAGAQVRYRKEGSVAALIAREAV